MNSAKQEVQAFHTWHSDRTYSGHKDLDPWMRQVLLSLQQTLGLMADRIDQLETEVSQLRRSK